MSARRPALRASRAARLAVLLVLALGVCAATAPAATPRASFTQVESDLMCVLCHEPLAVAQSPEAFQERQYVRTLIAQGETRRQIDRNMVAQYGAAVLALPPARGFNLLVYVLPPVVLALGIAGLAVTLPKWRRRARQAAAASPAAAMAPPDPADEQRLDEELARNA
jgi:cytochrome c-type biogenesis protein CcmH